MKSAKDRLENQGEEEGVGCRIGEEKGIESTEIILTKNLLLESYTKYTRIL